MALAVVVFPAPLRPIKQVTLPLITSKLTSRRTVPSPYVAEIFETFGSLLSFVEQKQG